MKKVLVLVVCFWYCATYAQKGMQDLVKAYPNFLSKAENNHIVWKDGTKMIYDDGVVRTDLDDLLDHASLKNQLSQAYPLGVMEHVPQVNFDPGRFRYEPFFKKMYGKTKAEVQRNLVNINWFGKTIQVTKINDVDKKLKAVEEELRKLPAEFHEFVENVGGTFNWRFIKGTQRQSFHSFGAAIDINVKNSNYWMWAKKDKNGLYIYQNKIPSQVVEIFEKHGFIWGGKWYHFDTMHFEYRPELL